MGNIFRQQAFDRQTPRVLLASLKIFTGILNWLAGLMQLTEEEQVDAGIQLGNNRLTYSTDKEKK